MILFVTLALAAGEAEFAAANTALGAGDLAGAEKGYRDALAAGAVDADGNVTVPVDVYQVSGGGGGGVAAVAQL